MKYHCGDCNYIYNEFLGEEEYGVDKLTLFEDLPEDFYCPLCGNDKDSFVQLQEEIHYPFNKDNLTQIEALHFPVYEIKDDKIHIEIGTVDHPYDEEHFIYKIGLYEPNGEIIEEYKIGPNVEPIIDIDLDYIDEFEVRVYCSMDGIFSTGTINK